MKKIILITVLFLPGFMLAGRGSNLPTFSSGLSEKTSALLSIVLKGARNCWDTACYAYNDYIGPGAVEPVRVDRLSQEEYAKRVDVEAHKRVEEAFKQYMQLGASDPSLFERFITNAQKVATLQWWKETVGARTLLASASCGAIVAVYAIYKKFFEDKRKPYSSTGSVKEAMRKQLGGLAVEARLR